MKSTNPGLRRINSCYGIMHQSRIAFDLLLDGAEPRVIGGGWRSLRENAVRSERDKQRIAARVGIVLNHAKIFISGSKLVLKFNASTDRANAL